LGYGWQFSLASWQDSKQGSRQTMDKPKLAKVVVAVPGPQPISNTFAFCGS